MPVQIYSNSQQNLIINLNLHYHMCDKIVTIVSLYMLVTVNPSVNCMFSCEFYLEHLLNYCTYNLKQKDTVMCKIIAVLIFFKTFYKLLP